MRNLTIVFHDAGGGHRNAALALKTVLEEQSDPWNVSLLNLQELLEPLDLIQRATGHRLQDGYNLLLRKGWTRLTPQLLVLLQCTIRLNHSRILRILRNYWSEHGSDLVLSVIPHFNACLAESIQKEIPKAAFVTVLTDLADYPPGFWIERNSEYLVCGTELARQQALSMGHSADRVFKTSGMVLKPSFYRTANSDRHQERIQLKLNPDLPTGIVMFGGHGSSAMLDITKKLDAGSSKVQLILLCGHNRELAAKLRDLRLTMPVVVEEFTNRVDHFMSLADFFIGKAGPGSISEALHFGLPVVVERNSHTMPQERYNGTWLMENRLGMVVPDFDDIESAVKQLIEDSLLSELRDNVRRYENYAVFEVPLLLDRVMTSKALESMQFPSTLASPGSMANLAWAGLT